MQTENGDANISAKAVRRSITATPPWVMVFGVIALALAVLLGILHLTGHGMAAHQHGTPTP